MFLWNGKLDLFARAFDQFPKLDARRAGGFAGATAQAAVHMLDELRANLYAALGYCLHLIDASAWRIHFHAQHSIGWAGGQTEAAVDALAHEIIGMSAPTQRAFRQLSDGGRFWGFY